MGTTGPDGHPLPGRRHLRTATATASEPAGPVSDRPGRRRAPQPGPVPLTAHPSRAYAPDRRAYARAVRPRAVRPRAARQAAARPLAGTARSVRTGR
ncbi:hypothetical protein GCM10018781_43810 [Kitasatospora indigofera]|uniref:Uncharacterized protein n=1 Tax=Kitasatospora indigofera TaxID=67307 RepID=A0A919KWK2_9ACTN|nr:hypothetical protein GCM10018781_43810 [Kitasatospora indigofera]